MKGTRARGAAGRRKGVVVVYVTASSRKEARAIGTAVVEERLAACAALIGLVDSIYRWKGAVQRGREALLMIKTTAGRYPQLEARVRTLHSYEVPEIIALPVVTGSQAYLEWVQESISK